MTEKRCNCGHPNSAHFTDGELIFCNRSIDCPCYGDGAKKRRRKV